MASSSSYHYVRSASYPPKSNPVILKIEKQLKGLRESEASSTSPLQTINIGLVGLSGLYKCVDEALAYLPLLPHHNSNTHIEHLINGSSNLLDICNGSRELLGKLREAVGDLRSSDEKLPEVSRYFCTRKEIVRSARELVSRLRQVDEELILETGELSKNEPEIIRVFRCVSIINISVMESFLKLLSSKPPRSSRFSLISKLWVGKCKAEELSGGYELSDIDVFLHDMSSKERDSRERMVTAQKRLEGLDEGLRGIENGLSCISSQLAKTRASLLKHSFLQ